MHDANYTIVETTNSAVLIRDVGPWFKHPTVTNAAGEVVQELRGMLKGRRLFYFDSEGELGELVTVDGRFAGFLPATGVPR